MHPEQLVLLKKIRRERAGDFLLEKRGRSSMRGSRRGFKGANSVESSEWVVCEALEGWVEVPAPSGKDKGKSEGGGDARRQSGGKGGR